MQTYIQYYRLAIHSHMSPIIQLKIKFQLIINQIQLAVMSKRNLRSNKKIDDFFKKPIRQQSQQDQQSPIKVSKSSKRKLEGNLDKFFIKQPEAPKTYRIQELLGQKPIEEILDKCQQLQKFITKLKNQINTKLSINNLLHKFLKHNKYIFWSIKYAPKNISELYDKSVAQEVRQWIKIFYQARSSVSRDSEYSFQESGQFNQNEQQYKKIMRDKYWNGKGLIIYGRQGTGKLTMLRCLAETMNMKIYQCSNSVNRFEYLKQKYESTKSQCVKINKSPISQTTPTIKEYFTSKIEVQNHEESTDCPRSKKIHVIHEFSEIYPEQKQSIFNNQLKKCMQQSKIPFILTTSYRDISQQFKECDVIQFKEATLDEISTFLYMILHIQILIGKFYKTISIQKDLIWNELNLQMKELQFRQIFKLESLNQLIKLLDYKFDKIFTTFQFCMNDVETGNFNFLKQKILNNLILNLQKNQSNDIFTLPYQHLETQNNFVHQIHTTIKQQDISLEDHIQTLNWITIQDKSIPTKKSLMHNQFLTYKYNLHMIHQPQINLKHSFNMKISKKKDQGQINQQIQKLALSK